MKQQGKEWFTSAGVSTEYNRVTDYERVSERIGQRIASIATQTEEKLIQQKMEIRRLANDMLSRYQAKNNKTEVKRFTFTTFDKGYKIEVDVPEQHYRVYRATKTDPGHKDYEQVVMDFSLVPLDFAPHSSSKLASAYEGKPNDVAIDEVGLVQQEENLLASSPQDMFPPNNGPRRQEKDGDL